MISLVQTYVVNKYVIRKFFYKRDSILYIRKQLIVGNPMLYYLLIKASSRYSGRCHGFGIEISLAQLLRNSQCKKLCKVSLPLMLRPIRRR